MKKILIIILIFVIVGFNIVLTVNHFKQKDSSNESNKEENNNNNNESIKVNDDIIYYYLDNVSDDEYTLVITSIQHEGEKLNSFNVNDANAKYDSEKKSYVIINHDWYNNQEELKITKVSIVSTIKPLNTFNWFKDFKYLKEVTGLENIDVSRLKSTMGMFDGCSSLEVLDLSSLDMRNVSDTSNMFNGCYFLKTIYVDENKWDLSNVKYSTNMFYNTFNIVGGNNTTYDSQKIDKTYGVIDSESTKGYLTKK